MSFFQTQKFDEFINSNKQNLQTKFPAQINYSEILNLGNNELSALMYAILMKIPINHQFRYQVKQLMEDNTITEQDKKQIQKFKRYIDVYTQMDLEIYLGGGFVLQLYGKIRGVKILQEISNELVKILSLDTMLNIDVTNNKSTFSGKANKAIGSIFLLKFKDNWYIPLEGNQDKKMVKEIILNSEQICLKCKMKANLKTNKCNHYYCKKCLEEIFPKNQQFRCLHNNCNSILQINNFVTVFKPFEKSKGCSYCSKNLQLYKSTCGHEYCQLCAQNLVLKSCKEKNCGKLIQILNLPEVQQNQQPPKIISQNKEQFQQENDLLKCQICDNQFENSKDLYCNICGHFYCEQCIDKQIKKGNSSQTNCPKCSKKGIYLPSEVIDYFQQSKLNKQQEQFSCHQCYQTFDDKKFFFCNEYCGHDICIQCIEKNGLLNQQCPVQYCKKLIDFTLVEQFYNDRINSALFIPIPKEQRRCFKCSYINQTPIKIEYFKCSNCSALNCGKHNQLLEKCQCICEKCFDQYQQKDNQINCLKCNISYCFICKKKFKTTENHLCQTIKQKDEKPKVEEQKSIISKKTIDNREIISEQNQVINQREENYLKKQISDENQKKGYQKMLNQEKNDNNPQKIEQKIGNIKNEFQNTNQNFLKDSNSKQQQECGGCSTIFDQYILPMIVSVCNIHQQCLLCKYSYSKCLICNKKEIQSQDEEGRELLIEEVYTKANNSRANFRNYDEPETPKKNVQLRNSSLNPYIGKNNKTQTDPKALGFLSLGYNNNHLQQSQISSSMRYNKNGTIPTNSIK